MAVLPEEPAHCRQDREWDHDRRDEDDCDPLIAASGKQADWGYFQRVILAESRRKLGGRLPTETLRGEAKLRRTKARQEKP